MSVTNTFAAVTSATGAQLDQNFADCLQLNAANKLTNALNHATSVVLASAGTVNIGAAASNNITISGAVTITAFDTIAEGALRIVTFTGAPQLTYNVTSMQLIGGASRTMNAGDTSLFRSLGSGNWKEELSSAIATTANRTDSGEVTVTGNATTGDIFAAAANSILWDDSGGAITTTAFPAASKAGLVRNCRCNGASKFTAGANLEIVGVLSGTTITLANKAQFTVRAITTTLHRLTYSASGSFTATITGMTTTPTGTATYSILNGNVTLSLPQLFGTSNSTSCTITGLPDVITPAANQYKSVPAFVMDNSVQGVTAAVYFSTPRGTLNLVRADGANFTASGSKGFYLASAGITITYNVSNLT